MNDAEIRKGARDVIKLEPARKEISIVMDEKKNDVSETQIAISLWMSLTVMLG